MLSLNRHRLTAPCSLTPYGNPQAMKCRSPRDLRSLRSYSAQEELWRSALWAAKLPPMGMQCVRDQTKPQVCRWMFFDISNHNTPWSSV